MALLRQSLISFRHCLMANVCGTQIEVRNIKRWVAPTLRELEKRRKKVKPLPPQPRATYLEWNYDAEIFAFAKRLGEEFEDASLRRAFAHRSYVIQQELTENMEDNTELMKEGEMEISTSIKEIFRDKHPAEVVNAINAYLTSDSMLSHVATHMGVKDLILSADFPAEQSTLAGTFKAIVAALKRSSGQERAAKFIDDFLVCQLTGKDLFDTWQLKNPYEYLLRLVKDKGYAEVEPRLCNRSAINTILANYQVGLYSDKKLLGLGWGESVEVAKDSAALDAIQKLQNK